MNAVEVSAIVNSCIAIFFQVLLLDADVCNANAGSQLGLYKDVYSLFSRQSSPDVYRPIILALILSLNQNAPFGMTHPIWYITVLA